MNIDITIFNKFNVIDTCAIDNLLSSRTLYQASTNANCKFCYTKFVEYEMFFKIRSTSNPQSESLKNLLKAETDKKKFECHSLSISDLQDVEVMEKRKRLGKGELSSMIFAKKTNQSFLTDDQGARKMANSFIGSSKVQTTPHLLGWLFYTRELLDQDYSSIIKEHKSHNRHLETYFRLTYEESLRIQLLKKY